MVDFGTDTEVRVSDDSPYKSYITPEGKTYVPTQQLFKTPAGLEFEAHRRTSHEVLQRQGDVLDQMAEILHDFEPDTANELPQGQSYEYTSS